MLEMFLYGVLLLFAVVATGKIVQLKRKGMPLTQAIFEGLIRAGKWVWKGLKDVEQMLLKTLYYFAVLALFLLFILWGLSRL